MTIEQTRGACFKNGLITVTFSSSQCVDEDVSGFIVNCSGSTCIPIRLDCPATSNVTVLTVTLGARSGNHEVDVYPVNRCDPAIETVGGPIDGNYNVMWLYQLHI